MAHEFDLVVRGGTVVDGTGNEPFPADVAVKDGKIAAVGAVTGRGKEEIAAAGLLVTPGFVDIHTHYDGQATWEDRTDPSAAHGVTTVVMGNCGVGFAPCRPQDRQRLITLMEGVEDIPGVVMETGLSWNWETFPEYLDVVESKPHDIDLAAMLPHACVRVYVMGERAVDKEMATPDDLTQMKKIAEEAIRAGAVGFGTSRSLSHRDSQGNQIPTKHAAEEELQAFADGMTKGGGGVIEALFDFGDMIPEFDMLRRIAKKSGRPISFTLAQTLDYEHSWKDGVRLLKEAKAEGLRMKGQVIGRPTGYMLGHGVSYMPFSLRPTYLALKHLPFDQKVAELRKPEVRAKILREENGPLPYYGLKFLTAWDRMFVLGDPPNYTQPLEQNIPNLAKQKGVTTEEYAYDALLEDGGTAIIFLALGNYVDGSLGPVEAMLKDENTILGLGDGGAHYGMICDAGYPTFMLTYWGRDAAPEMRMSVPQLIKKLAADTAAAVDLNDRGVLKPGYKADLNVIDFNNLRLHVPHSVFDLPANGRRMKQSATGFVATIVNGEVTYRNGEHTGKLPGKLVRGAKQAPAGLQAAAE